MLAKLNDHDSYWGIIGLLGLMLSLIACIPLSKLRTNVYRDTYTKTEFKTITIEEKSEIRVGYTYFLVKDENNVVYEVKDNHIFPVIKEGESYDIEVVEYLEGHHQYPRTSMVLSVKVVDDKNLSTSVNSNGK